MTKEETWKALSSEVPERSCKTCKHDTSRILNSNYPGCRPGHLVDCGINPQRDDMSLPAPSYKYWEWDGN